MAYFLCVKITNLTKRRVGIGLLNFTLDPHEITVKEIPESLFEPMPRGNVRTTDHILPARKLINDLDRMQAAGVILYEILKTVPDTGTGAAGVQVKDEGVLIQTEFFTCLNFIGDEVFARVNTGDSDIADIIHAEPPVYLSHWNTSDGDNGAQLVSDPIARTTTRIATPSGGEGSPFNTNGWAGTNQDTTLATSGVYTTPAATTGFGGDSTMTIVVYDADGTTILETYTTPAIVADDTHVSPSGNITVVITLFGDDPAITHPVPDLNRKKAKASVTVDHDGVFSDNGLDGGRFHVEITHTTDSTTDGTGPHVYTQSDIFQDTNPTTPAINGTVGITEHAGSVVTRHISGLEYYDVGSQFEISVLNIDQLNRNTIRTSANLTIQAPDYGLPTLNHSPFGTGSGNFTGWTNDHDQDDVDYERLDWAITNTNYRFTGTTGNASAFPRDPWANGSTVNSANANILIDTCIDTATDTFDDFCTEDRREAIDGVGGGASVGSFPGAGNWDETASLVAGEAMTYGDHIQFPESTPLTDGGGNNTDWSSYLPNLGGVNPDYSGITGEPFVDWGRRFTKTPDENIPSFAMVFTGTFAAGNMLADLTGGNVEIYVYRIARPTGTPGNIGAPPTNTTPLRVHEPFNFAQYDDGATVVGSGIREGSSSGNTINCTFGTGTPADTGFYCHFRILNTGTRIDSVSVTFF